MKSKDIDISYPPNMLRAAEVFKSIAHPIRLNILQLLQENQPLNVSDIGEQLGCNCEQSMLSHHLTKMKDKGILSSNKEGKFIYYSIDDPCVVSILNCVNKMEV